MGSLVAAVAHEVRNPLFAISSTVDAFEARFSERQEYQRYLSVLRKELDRLSELMRDLIEYGKPPRLELSPDAIEDVIAQAIRVCEPQAQQANVQVTTNGPSGCSPVRMDRDRLLRVFQNLLENAIQYSPPREIVTADLQQVYQDGERWIECAIKDSGPGFRIEDLPRIFDPFFTRRRGGTGLGLSIVHRIVQEHGGTTYASNRPEGGAVTTVRFPLFQQ
jgi:signal transduction histidine kinase